MVERARRGEEKMRARVYSDRERKIKNDTVSNSQFRLNGQRPLTGRVMVRHGEKNRKGMMPSPHEKQVTVTKPYEY